MDQKETNMQTRHYRDEILNNKSLLINAELNMMETKLALFWTLAVNPHWHPVLKQSAELQNC